MLRAAETGNSDVVKRELTGHTDVNSQDEVVFLSLVALYLVLFLACTFLGLVVNCPSCYAMCLYVLVLMSV